MSATHYAFPAVISGSAPQVWKKGVDSDAFHPRFSNPEMRSRLTSGNTQDAVMVYVGRLGHEKNLKFLRDLLDRLPTMRLAFVGDGPARPDLEHHFTGKHLSICFYGRVQQTWDGMQCATSATSSSSTATPSSQLSL